jgi:hypothetical protein
MELLVVVLGGRGWSYIVILSQMQRGRDVGLSFKTSAVDLGKGSQSVLSSLSTGTIAPRHWTPDTNSQLCMFQSSIVFNKHPTCKPLMHFCVSLP